MNGDVPGASRDDFLAAMRHVACSVAIVTTEGRMGRHGATVSAFSSVSADPPTVLICLRDGSRISSHVEQNRCFTLNVMTEDDRDVARAFSGEFDAVSPDRFHGADVIELPGLAPALAGGTVFACELVNALTHGSHRVLFGEVAHVITSKRPPLTYHNGDYRKLQTIGAI